MAKAYVVKGKNDHVRLYNGTGSAIKQGDFVVLGDLCGVADEDIDNLTVGSVHVEEGLIVQASEFVTGENTFNTPHQTVYLDPISGDFSDTSNAGYKAVGQLIEVKDSGGVIRFSKYRRAVTVGEPIRITLSQITDIGNLALGDLADVNLAGVTDNDRLAYDSATSKWIPEAVAD
jgi:hypothetical protein